MLSKDYSLVEGFYVPDPFIEIRNNLNGDIPLLWTDFGENLFHPAFQKTVGWWLQQESIIALIDRASKIPSRVRTSDSFAGCFFEQAAFLQILISSKDPHQTFFSPDQTFSLFSKANPNCESTVLDGFSPVISGLSFPDFIAFYINRHSIVITSTYECKTGRKIRSNQVAAYAKEDFLDTALNLKQETITKANNASIFLGEKMHEVDPRIPILPVRISDNLHKTLVTPFDSNLELPGFKPYHTDFYRKEFGILMDLLWSDITKSEPIYYF